MTHGTYRFITFSDLLKYLLLIAAMPNGFSVIACESQDIKISSPILQMIEAEHFASNTNSQGHRKNHDSQHFMEKCCLGFCDCSHAKSISIWTPVSDYGSSLGELLQLEEVQHMTINVTSNLTEIGPTHWHELILPYTIDGISCVPFPVIAAGHTFTYEFDIEQNATYWYHCQSGPQGQLEHLGPKIIEPRDGDIGAEGEHKIILSDWTFEDPHDVFRHLKVAQGNYNYQQRTIDDTINDIKNQGLINTVKERATWSRTRMNPRDILDVTGATYTYLMNGRDPQTNWTELYKSGESVRIRLINGSIMTYFDTSISMEAEYDYRVLQTSYIQPRKSVSASLSESERFDRPSGVNAIRVGLRYRMEVSREIAQYVGVFWLKTLGNTAYNLCSIGGSVHETGIVFGARA
ncbi:copper resistance protein B [Aliiglaciecola lipolytica]|uniref:Plastocyanin-like domain-containing protein n=1 Tax=Aliiglaciecola lipolytica E3 TaxID=1127673 RepID=K6XYZ7_9ALTE|nr:copper resistance protein B [Aliiglaciecola lipolytica]GAC16856.1 hypothetical protein GLIP_4245 [Aliiglaciecola lipolytica E3]